MGNPAKGKPRRKSVAAVVLRAVAVAGLVAVAAITGLRWLDPPTSSLILQANLCARDDAAPWASFDWRPLTQISPHMALAVIAAEDQRFAQHHGLDFVELSNALRENRDRPRGASTITQQVAKNMFLWGGRSYLRKLFEAGLAVYIDFAWGKRRVLEIYLNVAAFGANIYGVENASQHFFNKPAARLNRLESARLAAVLPNPTTRSATHASPKVLQRQRWILQQMQALGGVGMLDALVGRDGGR